VEFLPQTAWILESPVNKDLLFSVEKPKSFSERVAEGIDKLISLLAVFFACTFFIRLFELLHFNNNRTKIGEILLFLWNSVNYDAFVVLYIGIFCLIPYLLLHFISSKIARYFFALLLLITILIHIGLLQYFFQSLVPLGADFWGYTSEEIRHTVAASGGITTGMAVSFALFVLVYAAMIYATKKLRTNTFVRSGTVVGGILSLFLLPALTPRSDQFHTETEYYRNLNKLSYFSGKTYTHFFDRDSEKDYTADGTFFMNQPSAGDSLGTLLDPAPDSNYPFLRRADTTDVLGPYLNQGSAKPNIVFIVLESMGRAYSGPEAYLGSFTPFMDSLAQQSLYWSNFLSNGGRTFAVVPSLLGSLPFAEKGFLESGSNMPDHLSLIKILNHNGYTSSFYYGGDAKFDNMNIFLKKNGASIHDEKTFPSGYKRLPALRKGGFSWGYGDKELYSMYFDGRKESSTPRLDILLTIANHSPFLVHGQEAYLSKYRQHLKGLNVKDKEEYEKYKEMYACIMYTDDALRDFFREYSKLPSYRNTIFIITGDHRMPEIPLSTKIDRFHVPFLIYSPLLKRTARFEGVNSHFDVTPTLLGYLSKNYALSSPALVSWVGTTFDNSPSFASNKSIPLMRNKNELIDYLHKDYYIADGQLFKVYRNMYIEPAPDQAKTEDLLQRFGNFKSMNRRACKENKLIPDSLKRYGS
jgi:peptidoglycan-N-acetylglucosamine deacetylase